LAIRERRPTTGAILPYKDVLRMAGEEGKMHLLLGNGFSVACRKDIFSYGALFDRADFSRQSQEVRQAFDALGTTDFEVVMRALRSAATLVELYDPKHKAVADTLRADADGLRDVLVNAIAQHHPNQPGDISQEEYEVCRRFLKPFASIYSINYDLLLYWTVMQEELEPEIPKDDGFRTPETGPEEYVTWEVENTDRQNIHYLHGALHLFDAGSELKKFTWINTGRRLTEQIREALENNMFPLIVAEGTSSQKKERIFHSNYLSRAYRSFAQIARALVIFGHSFGENDDHILRLIGRRRSKVRKLFVSLFGDPESESNRQIRARALALATRNDKLAVFFYLADEANVWGHN